MKIGIFDLETSGLNAESSILLCCSVKPYQADYKGKVITLSANEFPSWKKDRTDQKDFIQAVCDELEEYDILVAHNGEYFDKRFLNSKCLQYGLKPILRFKKLVDPVLIARRHLNLSRNSLTSLIDFLKVPERKTPIKFSYWMRAAMMGDEKCLEQIAIHCHFDVVTLEKVYDRMRKLIDRIDSKGSSF